MRVLLFLFPLTAALAQTRVADLNANSWWVYAGDHQIKGRWGVFTETQVRRSDFASIWQQLQLRNAATYKVSDHVQVSLGYVATRSGRYGDFPAAAPIWEHRLQTEAKIKQNPIHKLTLEHRLRLEQRWIGQYVGGVHSYRFQERARYQAKVSRPVSTNRYLFGYGEAFLSFGANHAVRSLDQYRAGGGVGFKVTPNNKLEFGYMLQYILQHNNRVEEYNHTLRVQWNSATPLARLFHR